MTKTTYMKPETECIQAEIIVPVCASFKPKGRRYATFGSDLPETLYGHSEWVLERHRGDVRSFMGGNDPDGLEIGGVDDGEFDSRAGSGNFWD